MAKREAQIAALEDRLKKLKAQQQSMAARERTHTSRRQRKADTRRKILVGAIVLAKVEHGEIERAQLLRWLNGSLTRDGDRQLFGLDEAPKR